MKPDAIAIERKSHFLALQADRFQVVSSINRKNAATGDSPHAAITRNQLENQDWRYSKAIRELHRWHDIFRQAFQLGLPEVAIAIGHTRRNCHGYFRPGHNGFGFKREILINEGPMLARIEEGCFWQVIGTMLHELLHAWQDVNGRSGLNNYHNREFREKAASCGLIIDSRGWTQYAKDGRFLELLKIHGVANVANAESVIVEPAPAPTKLKKWVCGCVPQYAVRVAIADFEAACLRCRRQFIRA